MIVAISYFIEIFIIFAWYFVISLALQGTKRVGLRLRWLSQSSIRDTLGCPVLIRARISLRYSQAISSVIYESVGSARAAVNEQSAPLPFRRWAREAGLGRSERHLVKCRSASRQLCQSLTHQHCHNIRPRTCRLRMTTSRPWKRRFSRDDPHPKKPPKMPAGPSDGRGGAPGLWEPRRRRPVLWQSASQCSSIVSSRRPPKTVVLKNRASERRRKPTPSEGSVGAARPAPAPTTDRTPVTDSIPAPPSSHVTWRRSFRETWTHHNCHKSAYGFRRHVSQLVDCAVDKVCGLCVVRHVA